LQLITAQFLREKKLADGLLSFIYAESYTNSDDG